MSIGNAILSMMNGGQPDPRTQLLQAAMGQGAAQPPAPGGTPVGAGALGASAPPPAPPQPAAYSSPQDLMQLYEGLMTRQEKSRNLDRGIGLIASSFSQPENRANVLNAAMGNGSGGGGADDPMGSILAIHQSQMDQQTAQQAKIRRAAQASAIASEYGISEDVANVLGDNEQLDDYLIDQLKFREPNTEVIKADDGSIQIVDKGTGEKVRDIMGPNGQATADQKNYETYKADVAARGGAIMPFEDFLKIAPAAGAAKTTITNDLGSTGLTPMQEAIDKNFASVYQDWAGGGFADTAKQITQLQHSIDLLANGEGITGPVQAGLQALGIDSIVNPNGTIAREGIEEVVQRSLREILGAQFTEKEGERLIARSFNSALSQEENLRRVNLLMGQIKAMGEARQAQVDWANENGTLRGFTGVNPSMGMLEQVERQFGEDPEGGDSNTSVEYVEGDVVQNEAGDRLKLQGGEWVPF